jgi:pimeloyl-ACP methyl ester carboxylesterase
MRTSFAQLLIAGLLALGPSAAASPAQVSPRQQQQAHVGHIDIGGDIALRRMVIPNPKSKGVVLFLHGFPETLYAWEKAAEALGDQYEVHAFDWPGYGLSSRPPASRFAYSPRDYAKVLKAYIDKAGIDRSKLILYATDIGALPALLLALDEPDIAKSIVVGDFAPFDRPRHMYPSLQSLKSPATAEQTRIQLNRNRDEILANTFARGLPSQAQFEISPAFSQDLLQGWGQSEPTPADAFFHYYAGFTRDQEYFERNIARLETPVRVVWGEKDLYIAKQMGAEFAARIGAELVLLPGIGHYPHLQDPKRVADEVRAAFGEPKAGQ